jgi:DNA processing protein
MRDFLYALSLKYEGDVYKMYKAIFSKETIKPVKAPDNILTIDDENYPEIFKQLSMPPLILFYEGELELIHELMVGVIGSRKPLIQSIDYTKKLIQFLNVPVVSGLAYGIDSIAHTECLNNSLKTIAVIGSGFENVYPKEHQLLFESCHLVLSEYPPKTKPKPHYFIQRNRIIACLSDALIITEAKVKSGTSHTARFALELGKDIYCVPGDPESKHFQGCLNLINDGAFCLFDIKKQLAKYCK